MEPRLREALRWAGLWLGAGLLVILVGAAPYAWAPPGADGVAHDTYYVRAHGHYLISLNWAFVLFAAVYGALATARAPFRPALALTHLALMTLGGLVILLPGLIFSLHGAPHRYVDYEKVFVAWSRISTTGYLLSLSGLVVFVLMLAEMILFRRRPA